MTRLLAWVLFLCSLQSVYCQSCSGVSSSATVCSVEGQLCIVQTSTINAINSGRVQICRNGLWGTFATNNIPTPWSEKNAQVACREAGFSGAINSIYPNTLSIGDRAGSSVPVHYAGVSCKGSESSILNCAVNNDTSAYVQNGQYIHASDVFVVCRPRSTAVRYSDVHQAGPNPLGEQVGDIRLYGDPLNGYGAVEIYTSLYGWSSVCVDGFADSDAAVICGELGYSSGVAMVYDVSSEPSSIRYLYNTQCSETGPSSGSSLSTLVAGKCRFNFETSGVNINTCPSGSSLYAGVQCTALTSNSEGDIRLFGGTSSTSGIVELFYNNKWGMVCEGGQFALNEARAVCSQLELNRDDAQIMSATSLLDEESNLKAIWRTQLDCLSTDTVFSNCISNEPIGYGDCRLYNLAAVQCGQSSSGGLSSGAISGIIFAIIFIIFFIVPLCYYFGKDIWKKMISWCEDLSCPSCDCDCDCECPSQPTPRRTFQLRSETTAVSEPVETVTVEPTPSTTFGGFSERNRTSSSSSSSSEEPVQEEPQEASFTKVPPPAYNSAEHFPSAPSKPKELDLPPPYPGPTPAIGFAFPPQVGSETQPTAPLAGPGYPTVDDPAYPPPNAPPPSEQELPYPINLEYGGGAYPPPTLDSHEPS